MCTVVAFLNTHLYISVCFIWDVNVFSFFVFLGGFSTFSHSLVSSYVPSSSALNVQGAWIGLHIQQHTYKA